MSTYNSYRSTRVLPIILSLLFAAAIAIYAYFDISKDSRSNIIMTFDQRYGIMTGYAEDWWAEDLMNSLSAIGEGHFLSLDYDEEANVVSMEISPEHKAFWVDYYKGILNFTKTSFKNDGNANGWPNTRGFNLKFSDGYTQVELIYSSELYSNPERNIEVSLMAVTTSCAALQMLDGADASDWEVTISVYDASTEELIDIKEYLQEGTYGI